MIHIVIPHRGTDKIRFSMSRSEVEQAIGRTPERRRRNEYSLSEYDYFKDDGFFVYYDAGDRVTAIEFTPEADVYIESIRPFTMPARELREWARQHDPNLENKDGFISETMGLGMYAPYVDEPDLDEEELRDPAQTLLVFRPGSYKEEGERIAAAFPDLKLG